MGDRRDGAAGVTLADGSRADVTLRGDDDRAAVAGTTDGAGDGVDLAGHVLLTAAVEPHTHLDKAFLSERLVNRTGDLIGAIEAMVAARPLLTIEDTAERAERAARLFARQGYRALRTHVDTTLDHGLRSVEALVEVRDRVADVIDLQIVAMCGWPVAGPGRRRSGRCCATRWRPGPTSSAAAPTSTSTRGRRRRCTWSSPPSTGSGSTCTPTRRSTTTSTACPSWPRS